jgi:threonine/homoserine/homoserine lactone efflux protein
MSWTMWSVFVVTEFVLCLTPGPAVLFVLAQALRLGGRRSLWANLGILGGNAFYFLLTATGLGALLLAVRQWFTVVKWCGAVYLIYLGLRLILSPGRHPTEQGPTPARSGWGVVRQGFILQVANPKALLFFAALLPQFIDPSGSVPLQVGILAVSSIAVEFFVLAGYGLAAGRLAGWARRPGVARATDRVAGSLLVGAGVSLGLASILTAAVLFLRPDLLQ